MSVRQCKELGISIEEAKQAIIQGAPVTTKKGRFVYPNELCGPERPERKIVILGDTHDPSNIESIAKDADVVIHEATLPDQDKGVAIARGHSCPGMAGEFARQIGAKMLVITHFSPRFSGEYHAPLIQTLLLPQAKKAFQSDNVIAAYDYMCLNLKNIKVNSNDSSENAAATSHMTKTTSAEHSPEYIDIDLSDRIAQENIDLEAENKRRMKKYTLTGDVDE